MKIHSCTSITQVNVNTRNTFERKGNLRGLFNTGYEKAPLFHRFLCYTMDYPGSRYAAPGIDIKRRREVRPHCECVILWSGSPTNRGRPVPRQRNLTAQRMVLPQLSGPISTGASRQSSRTSFIIHRRAGRGPDKFSL